MSDADGNTLIPQPHGGALRPRPPAMGGSSWKAAKKQALAELAAMTPAALDRLWNLIHSTDDRVAMVASKEVADRALGKPGEASQIVGEGAAAIDVSRLTPDQQTELAAALATVRRLAAVASGEIQGTVEGTQAA